MLRRELRPPLHVFLLATLCTYLLSASTAGATSHHHIEDFTTTAFREPLNSTAWWDTTVGEVKLHEFHAAVIGSGLGGDTWDQVVDGNNLYTANGSSGLMCFRLEDSASPTLVGAYNTPGDARSVTVAGDLLFVGDQSAGLHIFDITSITPPTLLGSHVAPSNCWGTAASGNFVYAAWDHSGLLVIDIIDPTNPVQVGSFDTNGSALDVAIDGDIAVIADGVGGLVILDISNPMSPTFLGQLPLYSLSVVLEENRVYVAAGDDGLYVVDITDPADPWIMGSLDSIGLARGVDLVRGYAYLTDESAGLHIIQVYDPSNPLLVGTVPLAGVPRSVEVVDDHAYVSSGFGWLQVVLVEEPMSPAVFLGSTVGSGPIATDALLLKGDHAYYSQGDVLYVADISDPFGPHDVGGPLWVGRPRVIHGDRLYTVGYFNDYANIIDIGNPSNPVLLASIALSPSAIGTYGADVTGDFLVLGRGTLEVFDISNPGTAILVGGLGNSSSFYTWVDIDGAIAYCANGPALHVVNLTNPSAPSVMGTLTLSNTLGGFRVSGNQLYALTASNELIAIDVQDPTAPTILGTTSLSPPVSELLYVDGDHLCVGEADQVNIYDISDPTAPLLVDTVAEPGTDMIKEGDLLVMGRKDGGVGISQVALRTIDPWRDQAETLPFGPPTSELIRIRMDLDTDGVVGYEMSPNGSSWVRRASNTPGWFLPPLLPGQFRWRLLLFSEDGVTNSRCRSVTTSWLSAYAYVDSIVDVPGDQGGQARLYFSRSGYDFDDVLTDPVTAYDIYRRIDEAGAKTPVEFVHEAEPISRSLGHVLVSDKDGSLPPGIWESVATVNALQQDSNICLVPTLADSTDSGTAWSSYMVIAHTTTPSVWFVSEPDSGYSVDNIAPGVPTGITAAYAASSVALEWDDAPEPDFQYYRVYRGLDAGFVATESDLVVETANPSWIETAGDAWNHHYKVSVVDHAGNEGPAGAPGAITDAPPSSSPSRYALQGAVPNPFNPRTTITYSIPTAGYLELEIYDLAGRHVSTLVSEHVIAGEHQIDWSGKDDTGAQVASGVYLYQLRAGDFVETKRMVLLK